MIIFLYKILSLTIGFKQFIKIKLLQNIITPNILLSQKFVNI